MPVFRPIYRAIKRADYRPLTAPGIGGGAGAWAPSALFGASEPGLAYDFSDATKLYTDSARTTQVTNAGDAIGSVTDLSGNGKHGSQTTPANRPSWQTDYALLDGTNDCMVTAAIDFTGTDAVTVIVGVRKNSDAAVGYIAELSNGGFAGSFNIRGPLAAAGTNYAFQVLGSGGSSTATAAPYAAPDTAKVLTCIGDISADTNIVKINGTQVATSAANLGTGNFGNFVLHIGARNGVTSPFNGRIYRMIVIGRALTSDELTAAEAWVSAPFT